MVAQAGKRAWAIHEREHACHDVQAGMQARHETWTNQQACKDAQDRHAVVRAARLLARAEALAGRVEVILPLSTFNFQERHGRQAMWSVKHRLTGSHMSMAAAGGPHPRCRRTCRRCAASFRCASPLPTHRLRGQRRLRATADTGNCSRSSRACAAAAAHFAGGAQGASPRNALTSCRQRASCTAAQQRKADIPRRLRGPQAGAHPFRGCARAASPAAARHSARRACLKRRLGCCRLPRAGLRPPAPPAAHRPPSGPTAAP